MKNFALFTFFVFIFKLSVCQNDNDMNQTIYQFKIIDTPKLNNIFFLPINLLKILFLILKSILFLKNRKIEKVFSIGGYMSLPVILAARFLKLKIYFF